MKNRRTALPEDARNPTLRAADSQRGVALVITLSLLVLLAFVAVAFLSNTQRARQIESASAAGTTANELARSAASIILSDLQKEIKAGSDNLGLNENSPFFLPSEQVNWSPLRATVRPEGPETRLLVKQSKDNAFTIGSPLATDSTTINTATPSRNGRIVPASRWDRPKLVRNSAEDAAGTFSDADLPFWINVRPAGLSGGHEKDAVGRFAFNVYDLSGLPDISVSGRPEANTFDEVAGPARIDFAGSNSVAPVPGVQRPRWDDYLHWRFRNSVPAAADMPARFASISVWLEERGYAAQFPRDAKDSPGTSPEERRILGRQDLLNYIARPDIPAAEKSFTENILPFVRTHSASANRPAWYPERPTGIHGDNSNIDYRQISKNIDSQSVINPLVAKVVVQGAFTRRDGSRAEPGEPLMKRRFPLSKLDLVATATADTATPADAAKRQQYFGLEWDNSTQRWNYTQFGTGTTIKTLDVVAGENREPNFFEVLKAGILSGSLGNFVFNNATVSNETHLIANAADRNSDQQIFQIGAAIIDQYDADDIPTLIVGPEALVYGIENHPYIAQFFQVRSRRRDKDYNAANIYNPHPWAVSYLRFQMWNPHANAATNGYNYRIIGRGGETGITLTRYERQLTIDPATGVVTNVRVLGDVYQNLTTDPKIDQGRVGNEIQFSGATDFSSPQLLTTANADTPDSENKYEEGDADLVGFFLGDVRADNNWEDAAWTPITGPATANAFCNVTPAPGPGVQVPNPFPDNYYPNDYFGTGNNPDEYVNVWDPPAQYDLEAQIAGEWRIIQRIPPIRLGIGRNLIEPGTEPNQARPEYDPASPPTNGTGAENTWIGLWANTRLFHRNPGFCNSSFMRSDPRGFRFGAAGSTVGYGRGGVTFDNTTAPYAAPPFTLLPKASPERAFTGWNGWGDAGTGWFEKNGDYGPWRPQSVGFSQSGVAFGEFMFNSKKRNCYYRDHDGIVRLGDWGYAVADNGDSSLNPMALDNAVRPVVLNRPFRSVAEMGYTYRGEPWKSVNFHGEDSADAGLLELFSIADADTTRGRININKATEKTIQGMIHEAATSAYRHELGGNPAGSQLLDANVKDLAQAIHNELQTNPIGQLSQIPALVERVGQASVIGEWSATRGVVARALADNTDLRTWHLLIDVVAQSGRYPEAVPNPSGSDFIVGGEARYWVHVAIDRHSAEILDIQWEAVQE
jgi:Tfp pilus assembly protein PilX